MIRRIARKDKPAAEANRSEFSWGWQELTQFVTRLAPLETLEKVLPTLVQNLSLGRAQIAIDQLHSAIGAKSRDRIVFATASPANAVDRPSAAAIAIQQFDPSSGRSSDMATIIHAGLLNPTNDENKRQITRVLSAAMDQELHRRGARFLQWATDESDSADHSDSCWCERFGFHLVGTLDYMSRLATSTPDAPLLIHEGHPLRFEPIDWNRPDEFQRFATLTEKTYTQTLDCPQLANFRSAEQTLRGYRTSAAFDPNLWFTVFNEIESPIGCMVMASHQPAPSSDDGQARAMIELVYMGLFPESRGKGHGKTLLQNALDRASSAGADRMILAVDRQNAPARAIYDIAGFRPMLSETVWVKSLSRAN